MVIGGGEAVRGRSGDGGGHQFGGDGDSRLVLAVLARVAVVREHGGDPLGRGALECVEHDQQLHQIVVDRRGGGLDDENVCAADVVENLHVTLAVGEAV